MEPMQPAADGAVLKFAQGQAFSGADFVLRSDGVCRLSSQLARTMTRLVILRPGSIALLS